MPKKLRQKNGGLTFDFKFIFCPFNYWNDDRLFKFWIRKMFDIDEEENDFRLSINTADDSASIIGSSLKNK